MSLVKYVESDKYFPNDKYMFLRQAIIFYFGRCIKEDVEPTYQVFEYTKFLEDMYQVYCKYKEGEN